MKIHTHFSELTPFSVQLLQLAPKRIDRIAEVVAGRSYAVVPVVEGEEGDQGI